MTVTERISDCEDTYLTNVAVKFIFIRVVEYGDCYFKLFKATRKAFQPFTVEAEWRDDVPVFTSNGEFRLQQHLPVVECWNELP